MYITNIKVIIYQRIWLRNHPVNTEHVSGWFTFFIIWHFGNIIQRMLFKFSIFRFFSMLDIFESSLYLV